jgi:hypothetical protein
VGRLLRIIVFPLGRSWRLPDDRLGAKVASLVLHPSAARDRLTRGMFLSTDPDDPVGRLEHALDAVIAAEPLEQRIYQSLKVRFDYAQPEKASVARSTRTSSLPQRPRRCALRHARCVA